MSLTILLPILVVVLVGALLVELVIKSRQLSRIADEIARIKREEEVNERIQQGRDEFIAMLVHELRSPLSVIKGASDLVLKEAGKLSSQQIETLLGQIKSSSEGLLKLVNDILDVSKMDAGKFDVDKSFGDVNEVLKEVCDYYSSLAEVKGLKLSKELDGSVTHFNFDPERIKQVMNNLISNAIKYSPEGGSILIKSETKDGTIQVSVSDTGIGIKEENKPLLFHKYVETEHHKKMDGEQSTGLGLVISKGIIEAHGGRIWYEENEPKGSKFVFSLPLS